MPSPIASAYVELVADLDRFEREVPRAISEAFGTAGKSAQTAGGQIESAFGNAARVSEARLASINGDGFGALKGGAAAAGDAVANELKMNAATGDAALAAIDGDKFTRVKTEAETAGDKVGDSFEKGAKTADGAFTKLARSAGMALVAQQAGKFFKDSITAASDMGEAISKAGVLFGGATDQVMAFTETAATQLGQSQSAALAAAGNFAIFGQAAGLAGTDLATFSTDLVTLAGDLASFSNTSPEQAVEALGAALRGESEPIRAYGVMLDDATLKQAAMALGIYDGNGALTTQQKVLAAQEAIFKQTGSAQGDFIRTSEGVANQAKITAAQFEDLKVEIGNALVPIFKELLGIVRGVIGAFTELSPGVQKFIIYAGVAATAILGVKSALDLFGLSAGKAGKAFLVVTVAITTGIAIYESLTEAKREQEAITNDYVDALRAEAAGQKDAMAAAQAAQIAGSATLALYDEFGISARDLVRAINGEQVPAFDRLAERYAATKGGSIEAIAVQKELRDEFGVNAQAIGEFVRAVEQQESSMRLAHEAYREQIDLEKAATVALEGQTVAASQHWKGLDALNTKYDELGSTEGAFTSAVTTGTGVMQARNKVLEDQRKAQDEAEKSLRGLLDAQLALFSSEIQLEERTWATNDAIGAYTKVLWDQIAGTYEGTDATRDLASAENDALNAALGQAAAAVKLADDQAKANGAMLGAGESARIQRDELQKVADTLAPDHPLRARLAEYIDELTNKIPTNLRTQFDLVFTGTIPRIVPGQVIRSANGNIFGPTPQLTWVGDAYQREAVIPIERPARAMQLMDESGLGAMWDRMSARRGGGITIAAGASIASFPGAVIQDATDIDRVAQRTVAAVTAKALAA